MTLKAWVVTHVDNGFKYTSMVISTGRYSASKYVSGEVLDVCEYSKEVSEGSIVSSSGWRVGFFDNEKAPTVSEKWTEYLKRVHICNGEEDV